MVLSVFILGSFISERINGEGDENDGLYMLLKIEGDDTLGIFQ